MNHSNIDRELRRAFNLWSKVSNLEFEELKSMPVSSDVLPKKYFNKWDNMIETNVPGEKADIDVRFETGYHGDAEPFDGSGLILGNNYDLYQIYCIPCHFY